MKNDKQQTATGWLIEQVSSKEWQDMFTWHKEDVFRKAREMDILFAEQVAKAHFVDGITAAHSAFDGIERKRLKPFKEYFTDTFRQ